jgi:hypothetical protein
MFTSKTYMERVNSVPAWMMTRVVKIASMQVAQNIQEAIAQLEREAAIVLQGELFAFPRLAGLVPVAFVNALRAGNESTLAPRERAAIVLIQDDAERSAYANIEGAHLEDFLRIKWATLDWMLEVAVDD